MSGRIAVTGPFGRLGRVLVQKYDYIPIISDVRDIDALKKELAEKRPWIIVHAAAFTNVDLAELKENRYDVFTTNALGTQNLADLFDGRIIYISTDFVFDGKSGPYSETDTPGAIGYYGETKLIGERYLRKDDKIIRTTNLHGGSKSDFVSNIKTMLGFGEQFTVTHSIYGTPTYVGHLAKAINLIIAKNPPRRIINYAGTTLLSRYEFALMIANVFSYNPLLVKAGRKREEYRPARAGLKVDLAETLGIPVYSAVSGLCHED